MSETRGAREAGAEVAESAVIIIRAERECRSVIRTISLVLSIHVQKEIL